MLHIWAMRRKRLSWYAGVSKRNERRFRSNPKRSLSVSAPGCEPGPVAMRTDNKRTAETQPCSYSTKLQGFYKVSLQWAQSTPAAQKIDRDNNMIPLYSCRAQGAGRNACTSAELRF
jgi:hypothetical protein